MSDNKPQISALDLAANLNPRQRKFAEAIANGIQPREAYTLAGYRPNTAAPYRLQRDSRVQQFIAEYVANKQAIQKEIERKVIEKTILTKEWILNKLIANAEVCLGERKVKVLKFTKNKVTGEREELEVETTMRDASSANRALELLGRELAMFIDRREIGEPGEFDRMKDPELLDYLRQAAKEHGVELPDLAALGVGDTQH